jgi:hypothetical protein
MEWRLLKQIGSTFAFEEVWISLVTHMIASILLTLSKREDFHVYQGRMKIMFLLLIQLMSYMMLSPVAKVESQISLMAQLTQI